jgi:hypothetical protein
MADESFTSLFTFAVVEVDCSTQLDLELFSHTYGKTEICKSCDHISDHQIAKNDKVPGALKPATPGPQLGSLPRRGRCQPEAFARLADLPATCWGARGGALARGSHDAEAPTVSLACHHRTSMAPVSLSSSSWACSGLLLPVPASAAAWRPPCAHRLPSWLHWEACRRVAWLLRLPLRLAIFDDLDLNCHQKIVGQPSQTSARRSLQPGQILARGERCRLRHSSG